MMIQDVGGLARSKGLRPVLIQSGEQGYTESAWISPDPSIKFVLENLWGSYAQDAFVTRVACNYFNLCTMSADNRSKSTPTITFDPVLSQLRLPGAGSIEICDLLGRVILSTEVGGSYTIPEAIARGSYLVRWYSSDSQASTTILTF